MSLINFDNSFWRNLGRGILLLALSPLIVFMALVALVLKPFTRPLEMTPQEAADTLRGFIDGTGGEWDLDDFTSIELADPQLEVIRSRAASIPEPFDDAGMTVLRELLAEAEALVAPVIPDQLAM